MTQLPLGVLLGSLVFSIATFAAPKKAPQHLVSCELTEISRVLLRDDNDKPVAEKDTYNPKVEKYWQFYTYKTTVKFVVENLFSTSSKQPTALLPFDPTKEDEGPIFVETSHKGGSVMQNLNDQGGALGVDGKYLELEGDSDGATFSRLRLSEASKFTKGSLIVKDSTVPDRFDWADKNVTCEVLEKK